MLPRPQRSLLATAALAISTLLWGCARQGNSESALVPLPVLGDGLKITTWNLQWFPGQKPNAPAEARERHYSAVLAAMDKLDSDILCVQEVQDAEALQRLAEATGYTLQTVSNFRGTQEIAILSRMPAAASFFEEFKKKERDDTPPRGFAYAMFRLEGMHELHVYSVHLKSNAGGGIEVTTPKREEAARQLVAHANAVDPAGEDIFVLTGDFNHDPTQDGWKDDQTFIILKKAGFVWTGQGLPREETVTWLSDGRYPDAAFDHFLVRAAESKSEGKQKPKPESKRCSR